MTISDSEPDYPEVVKAVIDIAPTILEVLGIAEPTMIDGVAQKPLEGVSMAYTFDREHADAPSRHVTQYFEMLGNRAIYRDGWIACCRHGRLPWQTSGRAPFEEDRWELYNIDEDFSQSDDLSARYPSLLRELQVHWTHRARRAPAGRGSGDDHRGADRRASADGLSGRTLTHPTTAKCTGRASKAPRAGSIRYARDVVFRR